jgi:hypothetical protein
MAKNDNQKPTHNEQRPRSLLDDISDSIGNALQTGSGLLDALAGDGSGARAPLDAAAVSHERRDSCWQFDFYVPRSVQVQAVRSAGVDGTQGARFTISSNDEDRNREEALELADRLDVLSAYLRTVARK